MIVFLIEYFEKKIIHKKSADHKKYARLPSTQRVCFWRLLKCFSNFFNKLPQLSRSDWSCLLVSSAANLCKQFVPDQGLICIQTVCYSEGILEKFDLKKNQQTTKKHAILPKRQRVDKFWTIPDVKFYYISDFHEKFVLKQSWCY